MKDNKYLSFLFLFFCTILLAQEQDTLSVTVTDEKVVEQETIREPYDPLAPSRAAFYSAVVPGLGQAYNGKYWKIPIIYAGIGTSIYFYTERTKDYNRYRDAYKRRLAGFTDDEFEGITTETLIRAQKREQRSRDVSIAIAVGIYLLNVVDANVDSHLKQFNISEDLSLQPNMDFNRFDDSTNYGLSLTYKLN